MGSFLGSETEPSSGSSSPTTMRKRVVLPAPLGPTRPTFSPGFNWKEASTKINCLPYCLLILEKEINSQASRAWLMAAKKWWKSATGGATLSFRVNHLDLVVRLLLDWTEVGGFYYETRSDTRYLAHR